MQFEDHTNSISLVLFFSLLIITLFLAFAVAGLIVAKGREKKHLQKLAIKTLEIQKLEAEKMHRSLKERTNELEMQALRAQINPHFIFNCLTAINHFILINEINAASDYLTKFSRLIRIVLQNSFKKEVYLSEELESLRLYIELEQIRFDNHFNYQISCDELLNADSILLPPMLLQPYVENAIWHGLMHSDNPGHLTIDINKEGGFINFTIIDNGIGRKKSEELRSKWASNKKSLGMEITSNRLQLLNEGGGNQIRLHVIDLLDEFGFGIGTKVIITIPKKQPEFSAL